MKSFALAAGVSLLAFAAAIHAPAQAPGALTLKPNLLGQLDHPLRYHPEGTDFVIENGAEFFNRPLYGGNTAFRVDAGDRPEFTLYLPGRGGNLRFGLKSAGSLKWLHDAEKITARYRPGAMLYEVRDSLQLGSEGVLALAVYALPMTEGLIVRLDAKNVASGVELLWAYGGVNGQRGRRDGDIGTENVPIGEYFQLQPGFCAGNAFTLGTDEFTLRSKPATILGLAPAGTSLVVADGNRWNDLRKLFADSTAGGAPTFDNPIVTGRVALTSGVPLYLALQRIADVAAPPAAGADLDTYREVTAERPGAARPPAKLPLLPAFRASDLPRVFGESEAYFAALRTRVAVETPDPFINAAVAALNVAADAVWDEPQRAIMHGAIAWRTKLLGWRGPYLLDALGWHDRAREHFTSWAEKQNKDPIPEKMPPADAASNLARNEAALHTNGDLSNSHYDMNLVYIDALFRHLRWTGDLEFARQMWPVIERHLAWERRLFRREFGPEKLPLYEAYAAIWASDDLGYGGGGTAHGSAYNYFHNRMAAQVARLIGKDPAPFDREADLIARAMRELLWVQDHFAESKDLLGRQLVHPSAALWSVYHPIDSELPTPREAFEMVRYVRRELPYLPVHGQGVPLDSDAVFATSNWLPYSWSINNVVMGENIHLALAVWQAGVPTSAYPLMKSALLASMYMGISPGNVGSMNYLDVYRRESQRDFADGSGVLSRAIVEGLFGVRPDALNGQLHLVPGFPLTWKSAKLHHPNLDFEFRREGDTDTYVLESRFSEPLELVLQIPALHGEARVRVNGREATWKPVAFPPQIEITCRPSPRTEISISWKGLWNQPEYPGQAAWLRSPFPEELPPKFGRLETVDLTAAFNDRVTEIFRKGKYVSPRSPSASLALPSQGIGAWAGHVNEMADIDDRGLRTAASSQGGRFALPNGLVFATPGAAEARNVLFTSQWDNYPSEATVPLTGHAQSAYVLVAGSTSWMQSRIDNGEIVVTYADGKTARLALHNPTTWWPIEQDYFIDDYQFQLSRSWPASFKPTLPTRVDLKTGKVRALDVATFKGQGGRVDGGAATVLRLPLDPNRELRSLTVRAMANDVVIGLMGVTLDRE